MGFGRELGMAMDLVAGRERPTTELGSRERAAGLAWLPLVGLAGGAAAALGEHLGGMIHDAAGVGAAVVLLALAGGRPATVATGLVALVEAAGLVLLPPPGRLVTLLVAPMLGRWACVVQCYGGTAARGATGLAALAGRARFREFAVASVTALGVTLVLLDAVGLAVGVGSALATLAVRIVTYRRAGGVTTGAMSATSALVETSALVAMAILGRVLGGK